MTITTDRLILRPLTLNDLPDLLAINLNPEVAQWLMPSSEALTKGLIERQIAHQNTHGFSFYACTLKDGTFIGMAGLQHVPFQAHFTPAVEIGWRIDPKYQGFGYATEAARAILKYGFNVLGLTEIVALTVPHNLASRRVMEKIGMICDVNGSFKHPRLPENHPLSEHVLYRIAQSRSLSNQRIIDCLRNNYDIHVDTLIALPLGADIDASAYKAQTQDHSYFIKLKRHHDDIGTHIQTLLHDAEIPQIIAPLKTKDGCSTQHIDEFTLIVYPFVEGKDGFSQNLMKAQWITLGKALRQIHDYALPPSIKDQIKRESYSPKWRESVRSIYAYLDATPSITDDTAMKLSTFMKEHRETILRLVNRAEQLGQKIQKQSPEFVLCHSDIHGGNILIDDDGALYIVDWDQPIMAPKERDLMFVGGGVANVWNNPHEEELFYTGYGKTETNREILAYYRHERIVEDIAIYAQQLLLTANGGEDRKVMYKHFLDMFEPQGVVEIAFKTGTD